MGCKNSERDFFSNFCWWDFELIFCKQDKLFWPRKCLLFLSSLGNGPVDFFFWNYNSENSINRTTLACLGLAHENNDALSEIILSHDDVCAPYTHPTPWLQNWPISHQHRSDNFDLHKSFALKSTWLFFKLQSLFVLKLLYLLLSALFLCLWINCSIL